MIITIAFFGTTKYAEAKEDNLESPLFPAKVAEAISEAYILYSTQVKDINCFDLHVESNNDVYIVSFFHKRSIKKVNNMIGYEPIDIDRCGYAKSFIFERKSGNLIKEILVRS